MPSVIPLGAAHAAAAAPVMIRVRDLVKTFDDVTAIDGISFDVGRGEIVAFLGPNGAGKTTTIRVLTTLLRPTGGTVRVDDIDPVLKPYEARRRFGVVFQDPSVDDQLTASENLELHGVLYHMPRRVRADRMEMLLGRFGLWDRRHEPVKRFSGGMRRRLEVARALLHRPKVLFLDEPTLGLDAQSRNQLWAQVRDLNETERTTVFLTTHYMDEAERVAHSVAIIDGGRIVAQGSPDELKAQAGADSLERAFLAFTGTRIRDDCEEGADLMRHAARVRQ